MGGRIDYPRSTQKNDSPPQCFEGILFIFQVKIPTWSLEISFKNVSQIVKLKKKKTMQIK